MKRYSDEYCSDMMSYQVLLPTDRLPNTFVFIENGKVVKQGALSSRDIDLLVEYAPKLFDTLPSRYDLHDSMSVLVDILNDYRKITMYRECEDGRISQYAMSKHKIKERAESLKKHIEAIRRLIGGDACEVFTGSTDAVFKRAMTEVYNNPLDYIPSKMPVPHTPGGREPEYNEDGDIVSYHTKKPILNYLNGLNLPGKTGKIKEFIKAI